MNGFCKKCGCKPCRCAELEKARWKINRRKAIQDMTNNELFEATLYAQQPDDYDGCYTDEGLFDFEETEKELTRRLTAKGFLVHFKADEPKDVEESRPLKCEVGDA